MKDCQCCALREENAELKREIEAMKMLQPPPAIPPVAEHPVREVTGIDLPDDPA